MYYNSGKVKPGGCEFSHKWSPQTAWRFLHCWTTQGWNHDCKSTACWKTLRKRHVFLVEWIRPCVFDIFFYFLVNSAYVYTVSILIFNTWMQNCMYTVLLLHIWCRRWNDSLHLKIDRCLLRTCSCTLSAMESRNHGIYQCWTSFALWNLPTTNHVNKNWCDPSITTSWPSCRLRSYKYAKARETCWIALG